MCSGSHRRQRGVEAGLKVPKMSRKVDFEENALILGGPRKLSPHTGHGTGHIAVVVKNLLSVCGEFSFSNDSSGLLSVWPPCIHRGPNASIPNIRISNSVQGRARCAGGKELRLFLQMLIAHGTRLMRSLFCHFRPLHSSKEQ